MQYLQDVQETGDQKSGAIFFQEVQKYHWHLATRAKEVLAQCFEHGNGHESHRSIEIDTQAPGMTAAQAPGHGYQGTTGLSNLRVARRDRSTTGSIKNIDARHLLLREYGCTL